MLEQCRNARERWGGVSDIIDRWLHERQELLGLFVALPRMRLDEDVCSAVRELCVVLVDYCSSWHFEVYEHLLAEADDFNDGGTELAREVDPKLRATTDAVLEFSDDYAATETLTVQQTGLLASRLSDLGQILAERFEMEDLLIEHLHTVHKDRL